jgi:uncharacterized protein YceK
MKTETVIAVVLLATSLATSGCATVVNGRTQKIGVSSTPTGAMVLIDNQQQVITPAAVELARDQSHTFHFKKEGYQDDSFVITSGTSGWVWGNVLLGGLVGGVVDFASGSARKLSQDSVHVTLTPLPATQTASPAVLPTVATVQGSPPGSSREAQLLELKNLLDKGLITQTEYDQKRAAILNGL